MADLAPADLEGELASPARPRRDSGPGDDLLRDSLTRTLSVGHDGLLSIRMPPTKGSFFWERRIAPEPSPDEAKALEVAERVDRRAVDADLEMQVRPEAVARAADVAEHLALRDGAAADRDARLVGVAGREPTAVVDDHEVPVAAHPAGEDHGPARRRVNRRPVADADVDPRVHAAPAQPEAAHDRAADRPDEPAGRRRRVVARRAG